MEPRFPCQLLWLQTSRKSAIDAVRRARQRCWRHDWVLDLDVKTYFDSIDWELMLRAVRRHTNRPWVLLYIERWLKAPMQMEDGSIVPGMSGTPQGGVISPILANCFCIMRSTCGWREGVLTSRSSATRMTPFVTARAPRRRRCYGARLPTTLRPASWCCIPRRRRSSTARMRTDAATSLSSRSPFWDSSFEPER